MHPQEHISTRFEEFSNFLFCQHLLCMMKKIRTEFHSIGKNVLPTKRDSRFNTLLPYNSVQVARICYIEHHFNHAVPCMAQPRRMQHKSEGQSRVHHEQTVVYFVFPACKWLTNPQMRKTSAPNQSRQNTNTTKQNELRAVTPSP